MLKRLLVLVAALAALLVFVPTASAQLPDECLGAGADLAECLEELNEPDGGGVPAQCRDLGTVADLNQCLAALRGRGGLPEACDELLTDFPGDVPAAIPPADVNDLIADLLACLTGLVPVVTPPDEEEEEPAEAADRGYGYDGYGYDIGGYDGGVPEGGVASGFGPTGSDAAGAPLVARGAALLAVLGVLATGLLMMRRRRRS